MALFCYFLLFLVYSNCNLKTVNCLDNENGEDIVEVSDHSSVADVERPIKESSEESITISRTEVSKRHIYYAGFQIKRQEQIASVKSMLKIEDYGKKYKLVNLLLKRIFLVMQEAKLVLTQAGYYPGDDFPDDAKIRDALGNIVENVAFFGDIILRLPEITHKIYDKENEWRVLASWAIGFANDTLLFDSGNGRLLHLMAQELKVIPRDENYINPYAEAKRLSSGADQYTDGTTKKSQKTKKKVKRKGPKLGGRNEL